MVLLEFDYGMLETALKRAYETVKSRHAKDKGLDAGCAKQNLLQKLGSVARGVNDVRRAGEPASQSDSTNLSMSQLESLAATLRSKHRPRTSPTVSPIVAAHQAGLA